MADDLNLTKSNKNKHDLKSSKVRMFCLKKEVVSKRLISNVRRSLFSLGLSCFIFTHFFKKFNISLTHTTCNMVTF